MNLSWDLFRHYLLSRRAGATVRTVAWLCMAAVAIGVMSLVVVISVMNGFNEQIRNRLLSVEAHLVVQVPNVKQASALQDHPVQKLLEDTPGIKAEIFEQQDVILRTVDGLFGGAIARSVEPQFLRDLLNTSRKAIAESQPKRDRAAELPPVSLESARLGPGEIMIGIDLARGLGIFEGDKVVIIAPEALLLPAGEAPPFERVTVKGLITTNIADIDNKVIFYGRGQSFRSLQETASREAGIEVRLPVPENFAPLKARLEAAGAHVQTWIDRNSALFYALRMEKFAIGVFLGLSALIASFSIVTVLVLLLTQKRKDIGLLMSLGLSPRKTRNLFVRVGLLLSSIGIGSGLVLGVLLCIIIDGTMLPVRPDIYIDATIPAKLDPLFLLGILVASCLIAFVSAWWPARATTQETPSEALRGSQTMKAADPT